MIKSPIVLLFVFFASVSVAQQNKNIKNAKVASGATTVLASLEKMKAELKKSVFFVSIGDDKIIKDTIQLKSYVEEIIPSNCTLKAFNSKGKRLHSITWVETYQKNSALIKEITTLTNTVIFDAISKTKIYNNSQKNVAITEKHFLDAKQTVSETIDRKRSEGYALLLLPNGDINLKSKNQNITLTYDTKANAFVGNTKK